MPEKRPLLFASEMLFLEMFDQVTAQRPARWSAPALAELEPPKIGKRRLTSAAVNFRILNPILQTRPIDNWAADLIQPYPRYHRFQKRDPDPDFAAVQPELKGFGPRL